MPLKKNISKSMQNFVHFELNFTYINNNNVITNRFSLSIDFLINENQKLFLLAALKVELTLMLIINN